MIRHFEALAAQLNDFLTALGNFMIVWRKVSHSSKYKIPEYTTPQTGLVTSEGGHLYYGDHSDGFEIPEKKVEPHRHPYFEIFWLPDPSGLFLADFRTFPLKDPCLVFVSPGQVHGWPESHGLKGHMLAFDEAFIRESDRALLRSPLFYNPDANPVLPIIEKDEMAARWKQISVEYEQQLTDYEIALQSLLRLLIISSHRLAVESTLPGTNAQSARARVYQSFIKLLSGDIPVEHLPKDYAKQLAFSPDYLSECVREHSGHSAGDLIRRRVLLESKRLLSHSDMTISEIAYHLHFKDPSYFSRFFKKHADQSPRDFRECT